MSTARSSLVSCSPSLNSQVEDVRTGLSREAIEQDIQDSLHLIQGRVSRTATRNDWYMAVAYAVRDRILNRWMQTIESYMDNKAKSVSYLSAEFLMGPQLGSHLICLGIKDVVRKALKHLGQDLDELIEQEEEPGLGNGGLGRLAACFLDSLASLEILGVGYGIRYEFGIFDQAIHDGWQVELSDKWLRLGNPWEVPRPEIEFSVGFGGCTHHRVDDAGRFRATWKPQRTLRGVACDVPVPGYRVNTVNLLRLWKAEASESFDFHAFNAGDYWRAVEEKVNSENITKVLYPNDDALRGKQLRLEQQYFFVACSLRDMLRVHKLRGNDVREFHEAYAVQLNDTHPSIAVAELMRLLVDEESLPWDEAWFITQRTFAYTNHTLLPEALEKWPLPLFAALLPRHLEIIYEINQRFLDEVRSRNCVDNATISRISIIDETGSKYIRMAHLAAVGSHAVNGVAALHTKLLQQGLFRDLSWLFPDKFLNVTNGVTPRRWVVMSNPELTELISHLIGEGWIRDMESQLPQLEQFANDQEVRTSWSAIKRHNKERLANLVREQTGVEVDPNSLFDIHVKRFHEYKRQHLNILRVLSIYQRIQRDPSIDLAPRTVIFGGKAAPGYFMAKLMIKLIHSVADRVNNDPVVRGRLRVAFLPNFNVKIAHAVYPAAELSEQISTAGKEASGTGNMKFSMNGALTIGTLDGANIEIREAVGRDNFFHFGLTADEVKKAKSTGYDPQSIADADEELNRALNAISSGEFSPNEPALFHPLVDALRHHDEYFVLADYRSYMNCQDNVDRAYRDQNDWNRRSILNVARIGRFSSDRSIREYAEKIWGVKPVPIRLP